jgi:TldD protein
MSRSESAGFPAAAGTLADRPLVEATLALALRDGGDFAEVFVEDRGTNSARLDDGRIEELVTGRERGAGIRVVAGDTTGFAHTADLTEPGLLEAARAAAAAARRGRAGAPAAPVALSRAPAISPNDVMIAPETVPKARRIELLKQADDAARREGSAIRSVSASYAEGRRRILVANSDGVFATDERRRTRFSVQAVAAGDTGMQTGFDAPGRTMGFEYYDEFAVDEIARKAARQALTLLDAVPAPSGRVPVVLRRGAGGVLFHEACGHGLEADLVERDASVFRGRVGEQVAAPGVTLIDDGTYSREWGTFGVDDEGQPARANTLIEQGVLTDYMWDLVRARKADRAPSGNGRRETYQVLPMVRMTNTFLVAGDTDPGDIIADTAFGVYCVQLGGGQVNTATGDFVFGVTEGYLIEHGEVTRPIRAAQLIGNGPAALREIDAIGDDFATWSGMCGKSGQSVPVSAGQPTLRVQGLTIGGTAA